jgi:dCMP deaminase
MSWDQKFRRLAIHISEWSKDRSTKVGCVIVGPDREIRSTGYNGMPRGINDDVEARHARPLKYAWFEHAERNAIYNAARMGTPLLGCTLYLSSTMPGPPCADCTRAIIQSGIRRIVGALGDDDPAQWNERWRDSMIVSLEMIREAGVIFDVVSI